MKSDDLGTGIAQIMVGIVAAALCGLMLYAYTNASPEDKDIIFWSVVTTPQE
jgi:hypothetical protein